MLICDTHADTLFAMTKGAKDTDISLDRLQKAHVSLQTLALFVGRKESPEKIRQHFEDMIACRDVLLAQGWIQVSDPRDITEDKSCFMLSIEGCEAFEGGLDSISMWRNRGVRMAAICWNWENDLAFPAAIDQQKGLKPYGKEAVREMLRLGIAPDVSHLSDRGFWDLLEMGAIPLASHSCCRALCGHFRNLTDEQLKNLFARGGYVGVNFYPSFLDESGRASLDRLCDHFIHMMEMGGEGKIGFGSDFDGIETKVPGLENPLGLKGLMAQLKKRGLTDKQIEGIAGQNLLDYYDRIFPRKV